MHWQSSSLFLRVRLYAHMNVGVTPFLPYPVWWCDLTLQPMLDFDFLSNCRCLAVFPRHKGRTTLISSLPFGQFLVALIINR
jgi:hypothetical protein